MSTKDKRLLVVQVIFGVVFLVVGLLMLATSELHCDKRADFCSLRTVWLGLQLRTTPAFKPSRFPRARYMKTRDGDGKYILNLAVANRKQSKIIPGFNTSDEALIKRYATTLDTHLRGKTNTFRIKEIPSLIQWIIALIIIGISLQLLWASFKGEIVEGG